MAAISAQQTGGLRYRARPFPLNARTFVRLKNGPLRSDAAGPAFPLASGSATGSPPDYLPALPVPTRSAAAPAGLPSLPAFSPVPRTLSQGYAIWSMPPADAQTAAPAPVTDLANEQRLEELAATLLLARASDNTEDPSSIAPALAPTLPTSAPTLPTRLRAQVQPQIDPQAQPQVDPPLRPPLPAKPEPQLRAGLHSAAEPASSAQFYPGMHELAQSPQLGDETETEPVANLRLRRAPDFPERHTAPAWPQPAPAPSGFAADPSAASSLPEAARRPPLAARRTAARGTQMALALLGGLGIGLISAWWLLELGDLVPTASTPPVRVAATASPAPGNVPAAGAAAAKESETRSATPAAPSAAAPPIIAPPATSSSASNVAISPADPVVVQPMPQSAATNGETAGTTAPVSAATAQNVAATPASAGASSNETTSSTEPAVAPASVARATPLKGKRATAAQRKKLARAAASSATIAKRRPSRSSKPQRATAANGEVRDSEIGRLKSQAYSESSRDRTRRGPAPMAPARNDEVAAPVPPGSARRQKSTQVTNSALARCEKRESLFGREICKWEVCGSQWGKNGCPSYATNEVRF